MTENANVRALTLSDLAVVARMHRLVFPYSLVSYPGNEVIAAYYRWLIEGPRTVGTFGAELDHGLRGHVFLLSGNPVPGFLRRHRTLLLCRLLNGPCVLRPVDCRPLLRILFRGNGQTIEVIGFYQRNGWVKPPKGDGWAGRMRKRLIPKTAG